MSIIIVTTSINASDDVCTLYLQKWIKVYSFKNINKNPLVSISSSTARYKKESKIFTPKFIYFSIPAPNDIPSRFHCKIKRANHLTTFDLFNTMGRLCFKAI